MEETKKVQVAPADEEAVIRLWQDFGWKLFSSQEIKNTDSHLERKGDTIYNVTTTENYVNLLFKRETNMANYSTIKELENQYLAVPENSGPYSSALKKFLIAVAAILILIGMLIVIGGGGGFSAFFFVLAIGAIVGVFFKAKSDRAINDSIASNYEQKVAQRAALRRQAKELIC